MGRRHVGEAVLPFGCRWRHGTRWRGPGPPLNQDNKTVRKVAEIKINMIIGLQMFGTPISAIYKVTGLQFRSKFCPRGPALGYVKKFHPSLVKNRIKINQEPAIQFESIRIGPASTWLSRLWGPLSKPFFKLQACNWALNLALGVPH